MSDGRSGATCERRQRRCLHGFCCGCGSGFRARMPMRGVRDLCEIHRTLRFLGVVVGRRCGMVRRGGVWLEALVEPVERPCVVDGACAGFAVVAGAFGCGEADVFLLAEESGEQFGCGLADLVAFGAAEPRSGR